MIYSDLFTPRSWKVLLIGRRVEGRGRKGLHGKIAVAGFKQVFISPPLVQQAETFVNDWKHFQINTYHFLLFLR